jgi:hypothetical protein
MPPSLFRYDDEEIHEAKRAVGTLTDRIVSGS